MKKFFLLLFLIIIMNVPLLAIAGCSSTNNLDDDAEPQVLEWLVSNDYILLNQSDEITPYGVAILQDTVLICDRDNHCLREFDFNGHELRSFGQLGNGSGEFIRPSGLTYSNESLYVVDSGNNRIQVFDRNMEYQSEYELEKLSGSIDLLYTDVAICNDGSGIVLTNSVLQDDARAYIIDGNGCVKKTSFVINGYTSCTDNRRYCLNTFVLSQDGSSYVANMRESKLCEILNDEVREICEFPYKYGSTDFFIDGEDLYVLSCGWAQLDHFTTDGTYVETIWKFDQLSPDSFLARTPQNGFIVTDVQNKLVYFLSCKSN